MLFKEIIAVYIESYELHKYKMRSYLLLKYVVHITSYH
jgi:hypothetical protein